MPARPHSNLAEIGLRIGFWATVLSIPLLCFACRRPQHWLEAALDKTLYAMTLQRLKDYCGRVYRTDFDGDIWRTMQADKLSNGKGGSAA